MPYITQELREEIAGELNALTRKLAYTIDDLPEKCDGIVNYVISQILGRIYLCGPTNYHNVNAAIGALECAKQEFYRRAAAPYEDKCIEKNGDLVCYDR